ncbi:MAG: hypothetical protein O3A19_06080 [Planctomycetota bacterium]|jgi:ElaB/YqjD/DUF883 family membrane-anchored ribosome-binding protein|nr:hypothetical protein [Planctomycetota bacterium]MDA1025981.1 hypothetical protein [Planctomycetota bacterium]
MRVLLDETPCDIQAKSIGEAIAAAADEAERTGRLVVEVRVDGTMLSEDDLQADAKLAEMADEVQMLTTTLDQLLRETFLQAAEAIAEVDTVQRTAAEALQQGKAADGMRSLMGALETWASIKDAVVQGLLLAEISPDEVGFDGVQLSEAIVILQDRLGKLKDAMVAEDTSAICDCLLYELPEATRDWRIILAGLAGRFDTACKSNS